MKKVNQLKNKCLISEQSEEKENNISQSNGLENFDFRKKHRLFNSNGETQDDTSLTTEINEIKQEEEDELEIPAF